MRIVVVSTLVAFAAGCGLLQDTPPSRTLAQGYTPCNDAPNPTSGVICHPDQYCASQQLNWCHTGCLSDDNCSRNQTCVKGPTARTGRCTNLDALPDRDPQLDPGYTQCGNPAIPSHYSICQPSQYCYSYYTGECGSGCLSEDNCTDQQTCQKSGDNVGICEATDAGPR